MILVDTSVLVDFLRDRDHPEVELFDDLMERRIPWGITEFIYQEVLQGSKDEGEFARLKEYFDTIPIFSLKYGKVSFERAALLNVRCRRAGVTVRSTIDLLIAETALENDLALLHRDSDFDHLGRVVRELRQYKEKIS